MFPLHSSAANEGFVERSSMGPTGSVSGKRERWLVFNRS